jgi:hypothetical protein
VGYHGVDGQPMDMALRGDELFVVCQGDGSVHTEDIETRFESERWLNSNKGTKCDMGVCPSLSAPRDCVYVASPDYRSHSSSQFWGA